MMRLRSLLFVPGDRPERMEKAQDLGADALILDLEDAVAPSAKPQARESTAAFLRRTERKVRLFVRVNPLGSEHIEADLDAVAQGAPDGIVLPKAEGAASVADLRARLGSRDVAAPPILPIATETAAAIFSLGTYGDVARHLCGVTWGAEDLAAAVGAATSRDADGRFTPPFELARSLTLFGAHAIGVPAIETVYPAFRDLDGLKAYAVRGARDGFTGMLAIHPTQVPVINAAFTPTEADIAWARAVVAAFEANPGAGALQLDGRMIDAPHLHQARALLGRVSDLA